MEGDTTSPEPRAKQPTSREMELWALDVVEVGRPALARAGAA